MLGGWEDDDLVTARGSETVQTLCGGGSGTRCRYCVRIKTSIKKHQKKQAVYSNRNMQRYNSGCGGEHVTYREAIAWGWGGRHRDNRGNNGQSKWP